MPVRVKMVKENIRGSTKYWLTVNEEICINSNGGELPCLELLIHTLICS